MEKFEETLKSVLDKIAGIKVVLIGSLGLKFQGIEIPVNDVDFLTDDEGVRKIAQIYNSELFKNNEDKYLETKFYVDGTEIHCVSVGLNVLRGKNPLNEAIVVEKNGIKVLCMPLESELRFYKSMNRDKDKIKIKLLEEKLAKT